MILQCTILFCTDIALYFTILSGTVQYNTVWDGMVLYCKILFCTELFHCNILFSTVWYCIVLFKMSTMYFFASFNAVSCWIYLLY